MAASAKKQQEQGCWQGRGARRDKGQGQPCDQGQSLPREVEQEALWQWLLSTHQLQSHPCKAKHQFRNRSETAQARARSPPGLEVKWSSWEGAEGVNVRPRWSLMGQLSLTCALSALTSRFFIIGDASRMAEVIWISDAKRSLQDFLKENMLFNSKTNQNLLWS